MRSSTLLGLLLLPCLLALEAQAGAKASFSLRAAEPLFNGPAARAFQEGRYADSARGFETFLKGKPGRRKVAAELMAGLAWTRAREPARAVRRLKGLHRRLSNLGPYARYHAANQLLKLNRPTEALAELRGFPRGTPLQGAVTLLEARILAKLHRPREALARLAGELKRDRPGVEALALAHELHRGRRDKKKARAVQRRIWAHYPFHSLAKAYAPKGKPVPADKLRRATAYFKRHRHDSALSETLPLLDGSVPLGPRCEARFLRGHTQYKARRYSKAVAELKKYFSGGCGPKRGQEHARARYYLGRSAARSKQPGLALKAFAALAKEHPSSNLADDALLLRAEVLSDQGKEAEARASLRRITEDLPEDDMLEEAWWRRAWSHYLAGDLHAALRILDEAESAGIRGKTYYSRGRLPYWRGRILGRLRQRSPALKAYRRAVTTEPLSYYAQLAANRLRANGPKHLAGLPLAPGVPRRWTFRHRPLFDKRGFRRGLALLSLGLGAEARREFSRVGVLEGDRPEDLWLAALLFEKAGMYNRSHNIARRKIPEYQDSPPDDEHVHQWHVAYPQPFRAELEAAARLEGLPPELLFGIMREESGFVPTIESYAHAIGLTQLLLKTARHVAKGLRGVRVTRQTLKRPALNLRLGARYLKRLLKRFGHPALAVAGYNAGGGAVGRWKKKWPTLAFDELVERIPYEQTRNYTKRVVEAYGRYTFLYGSGSDRYLNMPLK